MHHDVSYLDGKVILLIVDAKYVACNTIILFY